MNSIPDLRYHLRRFVFRRRRPLAAALAFLAVITGVSAIQPEAESVPIVVAAHALRAGTVLAADDLVRADWASRPPAGASPKIANFIGETVAAPLGEGEPLTDMRVVGPSLFDGYGSTALATTIRIADAAALTGMHSGDAAAVIGTDPESGKASVISRDIHLLSTPPKNDDASDRGVSVQIVASEADALKLAAVALDSRLTLVAISPSAER